MLVAIKQLLVRSQETWAWQNCHSPSTDLHQKVLMLSGKLASLLEQHIISDETRLIECLAYLPREGYEEDGCQKEEAAHQLVAALCWNYGCMHRVFFAASG